MPAMPDFPESHRYLLDAKFATLATLEPDGQPQLSEIWFLHEGGEIRLSLNTARRKTQNLMARAQCTLMILDVDNPFLYVEVRGRARVEPDDDGSFAHKLHGKYDVDVAAYDQPGDRRVVVTIEPTRIRAVDMTGG
jgi:PPOX class probable F420-dependent enzyme